MADLLAIGIFPLILTLAAFRVGQLCQAKWKSPLLNPILTAAILVIAFLLATGMEVSSYKAGVSSISWLMTPATICLAIPMYEQFQALRKNLKAVVAGVAAGAVSCLGMILAAGLLLGFDRSITISLMPKSVTTAIGVSLSEMFGGMGAVTTAAIVVTGIFANMMGVTFCRLFKITHPVAQKSFSERGLDADKAVDGILAHGADDRIGLLLVILGDIDSESFAYAHFILG